MARPTNQDIYNKAPEIEPEAQPAVSKVAAEVQATKELEGHVKSDGSGYDVTVGKLEGTPEAGEVYHIFEAFVNMEMEIKSMEERPNEPPGQAKKAQPK